MYGDRTKTLMDCCNPDEKVPCKHFICSMYVVSLYGRMTRDGIIDIRQQVRAQCCKSYMSKKIKDYSLMTRGVGISYEGIFICLLNRLSITLIHSFL